MAGKPISPKAGNPHVGKHIKAVAPGESDGQKKYGLERVENAASRVCQKRRAVVFQRVIERHASGRPLRLNVLEKRIVEMPGVAEGKHPVAKEDVEEDPCE